MMYELSDGKKVRIPDDEIKANMRLGISEAEAIQLWLEDEGYEVNEEQNALDQKAKDNRITATVHQAKNITKPKSQRERVQKENPTKEKIIAEIAKMLPTLATDVQIVNKTKLITFRIGDDDFKLDLIQSRKPKK